MISNLYLFIKIVHIDKKKKKLSIRDKNFNGLKAFHSLQQPKKKGT